MKTQPNRRNRSTKARQFMPLTEALEDRTLYSTYTVTNLADHGTGSLRQAVLNANAHAGADTVKFASGVQGTIALTSGQLVVSDSVTIAGPGSGHLAVSGSGLSRVFEVTGGTASINAITIENGNPGANFGGGVLNSATVNLNYDVVASNVAASEHVGGVYGGGAGLMNFGTANVSYTLFQNNTTYGHDSSGYDGGGAIYNRGTLSVTNSTIQKNYVKLSPTATSNATIGGGGVFNLGTANITASTVAGNVVTNGNGQSDFGGGIENRKTLNLTSSTVSSNELLVGDNNPSYGGGIYSTGPSILLNSTIANNISGYSAPGIEIETEGNGGGLAINGSYASVINCTIAGNTATGEGGGIDVNSGNLFIGNTIVANNSDGEPYAVPPFNNILNDGSTLSFGNNLIGSAWNTNIGGLVIWKATDKVGYSNIFHDGTINPGLGALANNGGPTQTMALTSFSGPAVNAGSNALASTFGLTTDQRGDSRFSGGTVDIGAYEDQFNYVL